MIDKSSQFLLLGYFDLSFPLLQLWMACFKLTMDHAIHGKVKQTCLDIITTEQARCPPVGMARDDSITSASSTGSGGDRTFQDDETYEDLESPTTDMENDENYDDIAHEEEEDDSGHSGGSSGGRIHPPLSVAQSGKRVNSDPPSRHYRNHSPESRTTPQTRRRMLPNSPGSRPKFPEPGRVKDNYDRTDHDAPIRLPPPPPPGRHPQEAAKPDMANVIQTLQRGHRTRQSETESIPEDKLSRPAPDGNSFRGNKFVERTKPPPIAAKRNLLPESAVLKISDKVYSESLLRKHDLNGMYLLRGSARDITKQVIMVWDEQAKKSKHYTIFGDQSSSFALDQTAQFASLDELVQYYLVNFLPNTKLKLTKPCPG
ncbi:putative SH3 domain-binding protein 2 isoform X1 [Apostichopus japonicus]|uniref:Putative SH3 domain-binding protein 2 isoform X1 n=1 Tax=Stichopus japonicus TaxID=307972 RepID=A0A2G8K086_STIJA|nr:putative SH3 domain-binding protein 2 isoform X1 [Apostichopus japonicus]